MKNLVLAAAAASFTLLFAASSFAEGPRDARQRAQELNIAPTLTPEQLAQLPRIPQARAVAGGHPQPLSCTTPVAISANGTWYGTAGADVLLHYPTISPVPPYTNEGGAWISDSTLLVPQGCGGLYYLSVEFTKDSTYACGFGTGTTDDVTVYFRRATPSNPSPAILGSSSGAWSGEGSGARDSASYDLVVRLNSQDQITTWVHSDGGNNRCLADYHFTGYFVRP